jgi:hypothetical protein
MLEATIKTLATKDDLAKAISNVKDDIASVKYDLSKDISANTKWMFIFWVGQMGATLAVLVLILKKQFGGLWRKLKLKACGCLFPL